MDYLTVGCVEEKKREEGEKEREREIGVQLYMCMYW
jgi:hypothetical protein